MEVTIKYSNICEKNHEPHPEPLEEEWKDVWDIATDKEDGDILLRFEGAVLQLNRACVLEMKVVI